MEYKKNWQFDRRVFVDWLYRLIFIRYTQQTFNKKTLSYDRNVWIDLHFLFNFKQITFPETILFINHMFAFFLFKRKLFGNDEKMENTQHYNMNSVSHLCKTNWHRWDFMFYLNVITNHPITPKKIWKLIFILINFSYTAFLSTVYREGTENNPNVKKVDFQCVRMWSVQ